MAWPLTSKSSPLLFNVWVSCYTPNQVLHLKKKIVLEGNVTLRSSMFWKMSHCPRGQACLAQKSRFLTLHLYIVDKLSVVLIVDSERGKRAPNTDNEVKERPREKKQNKTGERGNLVCVTLSGSPFNKSNKLGFFWVVHWIQMRIFSLYPAQYSID